MIRIIHEDGTMSQPQRLQEVLRTLDRATETLVMVAKPVGEQKRGKREGEEAADDEEGRESQGRGLGSDAANIGGNDAFTALMDAQAKQPAALCKIMNKQARLKAEAAAKKAARLKTVGNKEVELNWAIADHDLQHKLKRLGEFLEKGMRVEVLIGQKRHGRKAERTEADKVLADVREMAKNAGGKEMKAEGGFPAVMKITLQGSRKEP
jgi:translation initiation factor IF-3